MLRTNTIFLDYIKELYDKQELKEDIVIKHYAQHQRLLIQNETATKVMLIKEGITKCFFTENNDKEYIFEFLGKGEVIGDIEFIRKIPSLCSIEAMTEVSVYALSLSYLESLLNSDFKLNRLFLDVFAERIINTSSRASYQQLYSVEYSLKKLIELQSQQNIEISKEDMAAYLGVSVRSLNRGFKKL